MMLNLIVRFTIFLEAWFIAVPVEKHHGWMKIAKGMGVKVIPLTNKYLLAIKPAYMTTAKWRSEFVTTVKAFGTFAPDVARDLINFTEE